jgi:hypothetical protein
MKQTKVLVFVFAVVVYAVFLGYVVIWKITSEPSLFSCPVSVVTDRQCIITPDKLNPTPKKSTLKLAILGDQGVNDNARKLLGLIKAKNCEGLIHTGDVGYGASGSEWDQMITDELGSSFPVFAVVGNHDVYGWESYQHYLWKRLKQHPEIYCGGCLGGYSACSFYNISMVQVAPGILLANPKNFLDLQLSCAEKYAFPWKSQFV